MVVGHVKVFQIPVLFPFRHVVVRIVFGGKVAGANAAADHRQADTLLRIKKLLHEHFTGLLRQGGQHLRGGVGHSAAEALDLVLGHIGVKLHNQTGGSVQVFLAVDLERVILAHKGRLAIGQINAGSIAELVHILHRLFYRRGGGRRGCRWILNRTARRLRFGFRRAGFL